ncbi:hypothetical protein IKN40_04720 [bacterium]|nr:hypothetical protein [bacterium]
MKVIFDSLIEERNKDITRQLSDISSQISDIDSKMSDLVDKIAESSSATVTKMLEDKIEQLESDKRILV